MLNTNEQSVNFYDEKCYCPSLVKMGHGEREANRWLVRGIDL